VELKIAPTVSTMSIHRALKKMSLSLTYYLVIDIGYTLG